MNATKREQEMAMHIYGFLSEQSMGEPFSIDVVMALVMAAASQTGDESVHLHGDVWGGQFREALEGAGK